MSSEPNASRDRREHRGLRVGVGHVALDEEGLAPLGPDRGRRLLRGLLVAEVVDRDVGARLGEPDGDGRTDAPATPRDEGLLPAEVDGKGSDAARSARNGTLPVMRFPNSRRVRTLAWGLAALTSLAGIGCSSDPARRPARSLPETAPRVTGNDLPEAVMPGPTPSPSRSVYASPATASRASMPVPTTSPGTSPSSRPSAPAPAAPPTPSAVAVAPAAPAPPPVPAGPERSSDRGDRNLKPSPIGQLAPEEVPTLPGGPPTPPSAPVTNR